MHKFIAALGTPCGGTSFVYHVLRRSGLRVMKENMGVDGTVCGFFAMGERGKNPGDYTFDHVLRYVRHPFLCAKTMGTYMPEEASWLHPTDKALTCLRYWVLAHERIDASLLVRIDHRFDGDWAKAAPRLGLSPDVPYVDDSERQSKRPLAGYQVPRSWAEWFERDGEYAARGYALAERFGLV